MLDRAVAQVFDAEVVWCCEPQMVDDRKNKPPRPNPVVKLLHKHYPELPNLGDITKVDWDFVEPVENCDRSS